MIKLITTLITIFHTCLKYVWYIVFKSFLRTSVLGSILTYWKCQLWQLFMNSVYVRVIWPWPNLFLSFNISRFIGYRWHFISLQFVNDCQSSLNLTRLPEINYFLMQLLLQWAVPLTLTNKLALCSSLLLGFVLIFLHFGIFLKSLM